MNERERRRGEREKKGEREKEREFFFFFFGERAKAAAAITAAAAEFIVFSTPSILCLFICFQREKLRFAFWEAAIERERKREKRDRVIGEKKKEKEVENEKKKRQSRRRSRRFHKKLSLSSPLLILLERKHKMSLRRDESTPSFSKAKDGGLTVVSAF